MKITMIAIATFVLHACSDEGPKAQNSNKPYWPEKLRARTDTCELATFFESHVLGRVLSIGKPFQFAPVDWMGKTFWVTPIEFSVDSVVRGRSAPRVGETISVHYVGPFSALGPRVIGLTTVEGRYFTDLEPDAAFEIAGGKFTRRGFRARESFTRSELELALTPCVPVNEYTYAQPLSVQVVDAGQ